MSLTFKIAPGSPIDKADINEIQYAFNALLEAIDTAQMNEPDYAAFMDECATYEKSCEDVIKKAEAVEKVARSQGITLDVAGCWPFKQLGLGATLPTERYKTPWILGADISDTWVPSNLRC